MNRYHRQMMVEKIGIAGQEFLQHSHVAIIGLGGLGSPVSLYLAGAGVGKLTLVDHDNVSVTNLHRQVLYREDDTGKSKADIATQSLQTLNKQIDIISHKHSLNSSNIIDILDGVDVIVDATDNFAISYLLSDYALSHQKPLVAASVMQTYGYVGVYCYSTSSKKTIPSLRAIFPHPPNVGVDCNSVGVIGVAAGMIGMLQAQEVLKVIVGDEAQLAGQLLNLDCWSYRQSIINFNSAPEPKKIVEIISRAECSENDWIIDVRSTSEVKESIKKVDEHIPLSEVDMNALPQNKRLVFVCASGQRALVAGDNALQAGFDDVAVCL